MCHSAQTTQEPDLVSSPENLFRKSCSSLLSPAHCTELSSASYPNRHPAVAVGKDAVCRASVSNLARLMDEMVTALARCKQPKLKVGGLVGWCISRW